MPASTSLKALRELNHARRAGARDLAGDIERAIDAADGACGLKRRPPERVLQHGESKHHDQSGRPRRAHRIGCRCAACNIQRRWRARRAARAFAVFDPRPVLRFAGGLL